MRRALARAASVALAVLRVGLAESFAYRAELLLWVLATTMPLVMIALFDAAARDAPLGGYDRARFATYFLVTLVVRHATSSWVAWQLGRDIRQGTLSLRLLRPVHPLLAYVAESVTSVPLRLVVAAPVVLLGAWLTDPAPLTSDPRALALVPLALAQSLALSVVIALLVGSTSFFWESGVKAMDVVLLVFMLTSGYLVPLELFPAPARQVLDALPFRYQLALPVELLVGVHDADPAHAAALCGRQTLFLSGLGGALVVVWRRGVRRFEAYGG